MRFRKHGDSDACFKDSLFPVDKLYADEVQDSTQCEVALMVLGQLQSVTRNHWIDSVLDAADPPSRIRHPCL